MPSYMPGHIGWADAIYWSLVGCFLLRAAWGVWLARSEFKGELYVTDKRFIGYKGRPDVVRRDLFGPLPQIAWAIADTEIPTPYVVRRGLFGGYTASPDVGGSAVGCLLLMPILVFVLFPIVVFISVLWLLWLLFGRPINDIVSKRKLDPESVREVFLSLDEIDSVSVRRSLFRYYGTVTVKSGDDELRFRYVLDPRNFKARLEEEIEKYMDQIREQRQEQRREQRRIEKNIELNNYFNDPEFRAKLEEQIEKYVGRSGAAAVADKILDDKTPDPGKASDDETPDASKAP